MPIWTAWCPISLPLFWNLFLHLGPQLCSHARPERRGPGGPSGPWKFVHLICCLLPISVSWLSLRVFLSSQETLHSSTTAAQRRNPSPPPPKVDTLLRKVGTWLRSSLPRQTSHIRFISQFAMSPSRHVLPSICPSSAPSPPPRRANKYVGEGLLDLLRIRNCACLALLLLALWTKWLPLQQLEELPPLSRTCPKSVPESPVLYSCLLPSLGEGQKRVMIQRGSLQLAQPASVVVTFRSQLSHCLHILS